MTRRRGFVVFLAVALLLAFSLCAAETGADANNPAQVARGKQVYDRFCAMCHGAQLEGQPEWRIRRSDGKLPAPPHDDSGHTWHHPDDMLFGIIKRGLVPPYAPTGYPSDMPAWGDTLKDDDIWAVLAYIKSRWSAEKRQIQADIDRASRR